MAEWLGEWLLVWVGRWAIKQNLSIFTRSDRNLFRIYFICMIVGEDSRVDLFAWSKLESKAALVSDDLRI